MCTIIDLLMNAITGVLSLMVVLTILTDINYELQAILLVHGH